MKFNESAVISEHISEVSDNNLNKLIAKQLLNRFKAINISCKLPMNFCNIMLKHKDKQFSINNNELYAQKPFMKCFCIPALRLYFHLCSV